MKYFLPLSVLLVLLFTDPAANAQTGCRSFEYRQIQLSRDPELAGAVRSIEDFTLRQSGEHSVVTAGTGTGSGQPGTNQTGTTQTLITIPVVVHVIYNSAEQNISDAQIQSQIDVLNRDYRKLNADTAGIPTYYRSLAADCGFQFVLARVDTNGYATTGIVRKHTNVPSFSINDDVKFNARGGDNAWDRDRYLNIWVCNMSSGMLGYSSIPGCAKATDGVTVGYRSFGTIGTAASPFNLGKTTTHEIGHWLNMIHIWGDTDCGDDQVADTPPQQTSTMGDPSGIVLSCNNGPYGDMYMNYMDFTDDAGMHMFTYGQRDRMRTLFAPGGFRYPILSSAALTASPLPGGNKPASPVIDSSIAVRIFPNPAVTSTNITVSGWISPGSLLEVYNQLGQRVLAQRVTTYTFQLDISTLPKGIYFLRTGNGKASTTVSLVKI